MQGLRMSRFTCRIRARAEGGDQDIWESTMSMIRRTKTILRLWAGGENGRMKTTFPKPVAFPLILLITAQLAFSQQDPAGNPDSSRKVLAVVLGTEVAASEDDKLSGIIFSRLLERFATENNVSPTDEDLDAFVIGSEKAQKRIAIEREADRLKLIEELKSPTLSGKERKAKEEYLKNLEIIRKAQPKPGYQAPEEVERERQAMRGMGRIFVRRWKINRALHAKYGGRVIFQQAGPEPLDAYRKFLKEQEKAGAFKIYDEAAAKAFWNYFVNESMHVFVSEEDGRKMMNTPWWLMEKPAN